MRKTHRNFDFINFTGTDELSTSFTSLINDDRVRAKLESDDFVAIKVESDSEAYKQFAQICKYSNFSFLSGPLINSVRFADKLVPFPSLFFIGKNGTPIEIVTGITNTVEELETKITGVLEKAGQQSTPTAATASANLIESMYQVPRIPPISDG